MSRPKIDDDEIWLDPNESPGYLIRDHQPRRRQGSAPQPFKLWYDARPILLHAGIVD